MKIRVRNKIREIVRNNWRSYFHFSLAKLSYIIFNPRKYPQKYASQRHREFINSTFFVNHYVGPALMELNNYGN